MNNLVLKQNSTISHLLRVTEHFALKINRRRNSAMLLLNLKKAFGSVWHFGLLYSRRYTYSI